MGVTDLPVPRWTSARPVRGADAVDGPVQPIRVVLDEERQVDVWIVNYGLACCAVEFISASLRHSSAAPERPAAARRADLLVVSGTVTDKVAPAILRLYEQLPDPTHVISFGSCANSGGPYWDSYCVTKGVDQIIPVDLYVPGCPPRPEALLHAIREFEGDTRRPVSRGEGVTGAAPL